ncbi:hypothetical protein LCGC14_0652190 [marine sediment metagenome]|uniref:Uncharacterized protein n=1 Tax=marine sediment metagenome TaxID=412755 RepID=A0A0F9THQ7_9ZZZZ
MGFADEFEMEMGMEMDVPSPKTIKKPKGKEVKDEKEEEPKRELTVKDVLYNHENRLIRMEAKWFNLGGI